MIKLLKTGIFIITTLTMCIVPHQITYAKTIYDSAYVSFSPDGMAWTTNAGDRQYEWYNANTTVDKDAKSGIGIPKQGEHYYHYSRNGEIPIKKWVVTHKYGSCIHASSINSYDWHDIKYIKNNCFGSYFSGWNAYCADCGERISPALFYMSIDAAESIDYIEAGTGKDYYYICPWCGSLEQGGVIEAHWCKNISKNQYKIHYDANTIDMYYGYMNDSRHMYDNAVEYEGNPVTPVKRLTLNQYRRQGYVFEGWNTMPDGTGEYYEDGAEILNMTSVDCNEDAVRGTVTLFAMWRPVESTLIIDAGDGSFMGKKGKSTVIQKYLSFIEIDESRVEAPNGYHVYFETGGTDAPSMIQSTMHFSGWKASDIKGEITQDRYCFTADEGNIDTITACYEPDSITLPDIQREDWSFGGWYYDEKCTLPAGTGGDSITVNQDTTLYAKWVTLKLEALNNMTANDRKGAVDLAWEQRDDKEKVYKVYQKELEGNWREVCSKDDISEIKEINTEFEHSKSERTYIVPYNGFYEIEAGGAKGGDYQQNRGGNGGRAGGRFWLFKGEIVTIRTGGTDGYNGGGIGSRYASGGGYTKVSTDRKGTILIAGGGGGASATGEGNPGGVSYGTRESGSNGEDGHSGGGGGHIGGKAGKLIRHYHTEECYEDEVTDITMKYSALRGAWRYYYDDDDDDSYPVYVETYGLGEGYYYRSPFEQMGSNGFPEMIRYDKQIPVNGATTLRVEILQKCFVGSGYHGNRLHNGGFAVYDQNGRKISDMNNGSTYQYKINIWQDIDDDEYTDYGAIWGPRSNTNLYHMTLNEYGQVIDSYSNLSFYPGTPDGAVKAAKVFGKTTFANLNPDYFGQHIYYIIQDITIPSGTTAITFASEMHAADIIEHSVKKLQLTGGKRTKCGYEDGEIISSEPAYGGSNYVSDKYSICPTSEAGVNAGDGYVQIKSQRIGLVCDSSLNGVTATDKKPPDKIDKGGIKIIAGENGNVDVEWERVSDNGSTYLHKVESFNMDTSDLMCQSNITQNNIATGLNGYYVVIDDVEDTDADIGNGSWTEDEKISLTVGESIKFLHIAPVDIAGNVGETIHIRLDPYRDIKWGPVTDKLYIEENSYVFKNMGSEQIYYVKCDDKIPFKLQYAAHINGKISENYQINYAVFESLCGEEKGKNLVRVESSLLLEDKYADGDEITVSTEGRTRLLHYPYTRAARTNNCNGIELEQKFLLSKDSEGKKINVIPRAGACKGTEIVYSNPNEDYENGICIVGDGTGPKITGIDILKELSLIDRDNGQVVIELSAEDELSGLREFYVDIENTDNACEKRWNSVEGHISMNITEDEPIFSGDMIIYLYAADNVGNVTEYIFSSTEFALHTNVERILPPHEPVFARGESGMLSIVSWGYADKVEVIFPEELEQYNCVFEYVDVPSYKHEEQIKFMIPLDMEDKPEYVITVKAYKGDKKIEKYPKINMIKVEGTVLDELRTRLR